MSTLFVHATIITVNSAREVIHNGYLLVHGRQISATGKCPPPSSITDLEPETINCTGQIMIPGLINIHAHLVQSLLRGLAEDLPLHNWLCDAIWPLESVYEGDDGYNAARLTITEMLKTGTTTFLDPMVTYRAGWDNVCRAVGEMGIRGCLGKLVKFPETNRQLSITDPRDQDLLNMSIPALLSHHGQHHGQHHGRLQVWAAAGTPRGAPASLYHELGETCASKGISITMHCAEAPRDRDIYHDTYGCSAMEFIRDTKLYGQPVTLPATNGDAKKPPSQSQSQSQSHHLVLAHMVNLDLPLDLPLLSSTKTAVAHNPSSNLKLASGIAPIPAMLAHATTDPNQDRNPITIGLGTDGAPCSNHYDMIQEMHLAAILHKGVNHDATLIPAETALEMATIQGARALGLEREIGSLEVGKRADLVLVDPYGRGGVGAAPWGWDDYDQDGGGVTAVTTVVHGCTGRDVGVVMVDGEILVRDGELVSGGREKEREIMRAARTAARGIRGRCKERGIGGVLKCGWSNV